MIVGSSLRKRRKEASLLNRRSDTDPAPPAYVSIRQHTSAYVRQHMSAYVRRRHRSINEGAILSRTILLRIPLPPSERVTPLRGCLCRACSTCDKRFALPAVAASRPPNNDLRGV